MSKNKHHEHAFLKLLGLLLLVAGLCFGGLAAWHFLSDRDNSGDVVKNEPTPEKEATDVLAEETGENGETTEGDENKTQAAENENNREEIKKDKDGLKIASINLVADYENGSLNAHGSITNIVEEGGSCTYILSGPNGKVISEKTDTVTDFHSTLCQAVDFTNEELGAGTWKVTLKYKSNTAEGESETKTISVQ